MWRREIELIGRTPACHVQGLALFLRWREGEKERRWGPGEREKADRDSRKMEGRWKSKSSFSSVDK